MTRLLIYLLGALFLLSSIARDRNRNASTTPTLTEKAISAGFNHTLIINEGKVTAFGENTYGQLGDGSFSYSIPGVPAMGLDHIIAVSAGRRHSMALRADGKVFVWGDNTYGQLGTVGVGSAIPLQLSGVSDIIDIQAGDFHCIALKSDGTVITWGINNLGELGRGFTSASELPGNVIDVSGSGNLEGITLISAGARHSLAIIDGNVLAWGDNLNTQLGKLPSTTTFSATPDYVMKGKFFPLTLNNIVALSAGETHSMATDVEGKLWTWGEGVYGQLGLGITLDPSDPSTFRRRRATEVASKVRTMAAGYSHSTFIDSKGQLHFFGANFHGQLGIPLTTTRVESDSTVGYNKAVALACGTDFTIILKSDGTIVGAGDNAHEQLGPMLSPSMPSFVSFFNKVDRIAQVANQSNSYVLKSDGTVWSFGHKDYVGFSASTHVDSATQISSLIDIIAIGGANKTAFALDVNGDLWSWGSDRSGACGLGTTDTLYTVPHKITSISNIVFVEGSIQGSPFKSHVSAVGVDGTLYMWGHNGTRELSDGTLTTRLSPVISTLPGKVFSTSLCSQNSYALYADNSIKVWGDYVFDGGAITGYSPKFINSTEKFKAISSSRSIKVGLTTKGNLLIWGRTSNAPNFFDITQKSTYPYPWELTPSLIYETTTSSTLVQNVKFVDSGDDVVLFIRSDGSVSGWGRNDVAQLGRGYASPEEYDTDVVLCAASGYSEAMYHTLSVEHHVLGNRSTIEVESWGANQYGEVGNGIFGTRPFYELGCSIAARTAHVLSADELQHESIQIYPNPASETLRIELPLEMIQQAAELRIIDVSGKAIYHTEEISTNTDLKVSHLKEGLYILEIGSIKKRIVIKR